jgi:hypothetical protein
MNLLNNGGFETAWGEDGSHRCHVFPVDDPPCFADFGNIFTPSGGWVTWFRHDPGTWDQPEVRDAWKSGDPHRVRSGEKAVLLFTFYRRHDAGFYQRVHVAPGTRLRLASWAHAWSNHLSGADGGHPHDPRWSDGSLVGYDAVAIKEGEAPLLNGDPQNDANGNFLFSIGIDPAGGTDPFDDRVVWGTAYHIYNGYAQELAVETQAATDTVTVFLRSTTLWPFNHNDAYWDDVALEAVGEPGPEPWRGQPRIQYERTYILMPPDGDCDLVDAVSHATWDERRFTLGGSADDAGIGDLDYRRIIAINPEAWADDLAAFYREYYTGVEYVPLPGCTADNAGDKLRALLEGGEPPPPHPPLPPPPRTTRGHVGLHLQTMAGGWDEFVRELRPPVCKVLASMQDVRGIKRHCLDTTVVWRHVTNFYGDTLECPDPMRGARNWIDKFRDSLYEVCDQMAQEFPSLKRPYFYVESLNEVYPSLNAPHVERAATFDIAFIDALAETGLPVAPAVFCAAVGNPHESEYELLVPLARKCEEAGGLAGYHNYFWANQQVSGLESWWEWHAGRWQGMDDVFTSHGIHARWYGGESGAVGSADGYHLLANAGWRAPECYGGDWGRYLADILRADELIRDWNAGHGDRYLGYVIFTTGAEYTGWAEFQIGADEMRSISGALEERYG